MVLYYSDTPIRDFAWLADNEIHITADTDNQSDIYVAKIPHF